MTTSASASTSVHHGLATHEVVLLLETDPHRGLTSQEAADRLARFGPNALPAVGGAWLPMRLLRQFHHPLIYVLLAAGGDHHGSGRIRRLGGDLRSGLDQRDRRLLETFYLFSCRSLNRSAWRVGLFSNRWIIGGVTVQAAGQLAITHLPAMNTVFSTAPVGADVWLRILSISRGGGPRGGRRQAPATAEGMYPGWLSPRPSPAWVAAMHVDDDR